MSETFTNISREAIDIDDIQAHLVEIRQEGAKFYKNLEIQEAKALQNKLDEVQVVLQQNMNEMNTDVDFFVPRKTAFQKFDDDAVVEAENRIKNIKEVKEMLRKKKI